MRPLPDATLLAKLVTNVTTTMLGIAFVPVLGAPAGGAKWRTALLPIPGARPLTIGLSSDAESCNRLCAAMFSCARDAVDASMIDDSLRELTNMTAGLVKSTLALDQVLGLPKILEGDGHPSTLGPPDGQSVLLKAEQLGLFLWVREGI